LLFFSSSVLFWVTRGGGCGASKVADFMLLRLFWTVTDLRWGDGGCRICDSLVYLVFSEAFSGSWVVFRWFHNFGGGRSRSVSFRRRRRLGVVVVLVR
jgi:hypothetical protein